MFLSTIDQFCRNNLYKQTIFIGDNLYINYKILFLKDEYILLIR
jgi:hypothetical protein